MTIRQLTKDDLPQAQTLIWDTFLSFEAPDYAQAGIDTFYTCLYDPVFLDGLTFYGAYQAGALIGVLATRSSGSHISMFFVREGCQQQGIGRRLFSHMLEAATHSKITVNSSPFAVGIYEKLGFKQTDTEQLTDGIRYTPMVYIIQ